VSEPSPRPLAPGQRLGEFVLREKIGEGGFGQVYRAEQPLLQRQAVIKVLHARHRASDEVIQRFMREARLASRLDHPYAAHVYAFGAEPNGILWIAMELVRGVPLDQLLETQGPLPLARFVPLLDRICEVVFTAHEQGIVHRDLKPANVMVLARAGRLLPKLLDFGIAKMVGDEAAPELTPAAGVKLPSQSRLSPLDATLTHGAGMLGSPRFMAPEQWVNAPTVGPRTDLYALGVLAYIALTGRAPHDGGTVMAIARAHTLGEVPPLGAGFPTALDAVFRKALAKRPDDRYGSALELAAAFRQAAGLSGERADLPQLDEALADALIQSGPQPIAESVVALQAARSVHQAMDALWGLADVVVRYLGLLSLASRTRVGAGGHADPPRVEELLRLLYRRSLGNGEWLELARELCRPFAGRSDAHPLPELVQHFFPPDGSGVADRERSWQTLLGYREGAVVATEEDLLPRLGAGLTALAAVLRGLTFLSEYVLAVADAQVAQLWMGARRSRFVRATLSGRPLDRRQVVLLDGEHAPVVSLAPIAQAAAPTPGAPEELFLFEGRGHNGALLVARPSGFERRDDDVWRWFREHLFASVGDDGMTSAADEASPYLGLSSFGPGDGARFFGREREAETLVNRVRTSSLVTVVGPSGAGKSSLVHAGMVPSLPSGWRTVSLRPGYAPMLSLDAALARLDGDRVSLRDDPEAFAARLVALAGRGVLVLIVDQLEEMFTLCTSEAERTAFAAALTGAARSAEFPVRVVMTLRDDFLIRAEGQAALRARLAPSMQLVTTPPVEQLERILVEPARRAGYEFEDHALPTEMAAEVAGQAGALPLLSFTAAKLWELRDRHFKQLGRKAYRAMGGVGGALAQHAEAMLARLRPDEQRLVRAAFRHLVTSEGTRAVLSRAELSQALGGGPADAVIEKLIDARLLVVSESEAHEQRLEVAHEALLGAWPRLVDWRREDAEGARLRDQLRAAARQWQERGRPRGLLWRDEALAELQLWRSRHGGGLTATDEAFAQASLDDASRARRRRRAALAGAFLVLGAFITGLGTLYHQSQARLAEQYEDTGRKELLEGDPRKALVYFDEALQRGRDRAALRFAIARAEDALRAQRLPTFVGHTAPVFVGVLSPDGTRLVTGGLDRTARVWDTASGALLHTLQHGGDLTNLDVGTDGKRVATASVDGLVRIFDLGSGELLRSIETGDPGDGVRARFSPDLRRMATNAAGNAVQLWDYADGHALLRLRGHEQPIDSIRFNREGTRLVTASKDGTARVWDVATGQTVLVLRAHVGEVLLAEFSAARERLLTVGVDGTVRIWSAAGLLLHTFEGPPDSVRHAQLSHDGRQVAAGGTDHLVRVWSAEDGKLLALLRGHQGEVSSVYFTDDDKHLLSSGDDGVSILWDLHTGVPLTRLVGHEGAAAALPPRGPLAYTIGSDASVRAWDLGLNDRVATLGDGSQAVREVRFGSDGLRALGSDGSFPLWDVHDGRTIRSAKVPEAIDGGAISFDGRRGATYAGAKAALRDLDSGAALHTLVGHADTLSVVAFSTDGSMLITGGRDRTARVWDGATGALRLTLPEHDEEVFAAAAQPGLVVTATMRGTLYYWDGRSGALLARGDGAHRGGIGSVTFSPDGRTLLSTGQDRLAKIWGVADRELRLSLAGHHGQVISGAYSPDGALIATTGYDGSVFTWEAASGKLLYAYPGHGKPPSGLAWSPDGAELASGADDGRIVVWRASRQPDPTSALLATHRCRLPFAFDNGQVLPLRVPARCDETMRSK
jgi:WD40 repeat protein/tRNA A-37 threonylcarbamoyl transferase component Bud32